MKVSSSDDSRSSHMCQVHNEGWSLHQKHSYWFKNLGALFEAASPLALLHSKYSVNAQRGKVPGSLALTASLMATAFSSKLLLHLARVQAGIPGAVKHLWEEES